MESIGARIERLGAERLGCTGKLLAAKLGVTYETLRKWKSGDIAPNRTRQEQIARQLGVPISAFMLPGGDAQGDPPISKDEQRLLAAYRVVLAEDRDKALAALERRAREVEEIELRIRTERGVFAPAAAPSRKRRTRGA